MIDLEKLIVKVQNQMKAYDNVVLSLDDATSFLALLSPLAAGTHVIAPVEPTEEMILKGHHQIDWCRDKQDTSVPEHETQRWTVGKETGGTTCGDDIRDAYRAMLSANQKATP
jgi:hypothetical protein